MEYVTEKSLHVSEHYDARWVETRGLSLPETLKWIYELFLKLWFMYALSLWLDKANSEGSTLTARL